MGKHHKQLDHVACLYVEGDRFCLYCRLKKEFDEAMKKGSHSMLCAAQSGEPCDCRATAHVEHKVSSTIVETAAKWPARFSNEWYEEYALYQNMCSLHGHTCEKTDYWDIAGWMGSEKRAEWQQEEANKFAAQFSAAVENAIVTETENVIKDRIGDAADRKAVPLFAGVLAYFPDAFVELARLSKIGNDQHNPGEPLHWARGKSGDELDALTRHLLDAGSIDVDGVRHSTKLLWRAAANLQKELERDLGLPLSRGSKEGKKA